MIRPDKETAKNEDCIWCVCKVKGDFTKWHYSAKSKVSIGFIWCTAKFQKYPVASICDIGEIRSKIAPEDRFSQSCMHNEILTGNTVVRIQ